MKMKERLDMTTPLKLCLEIAALFLKILLGSTCDNAEILGDEVLPKKVFLKRISSYFVPHLSLATVCLAATRANQ